MVATRAAARFVARVEADDTRHVGFARGWSDCSRRSSRRRARGRSDCGDHRATFVRRWAYRRTPAYMYTHIHIETFVTRRARRRVRESRGGTRLRRETANTQPLLRKFVILPNGEAAALAGRAGLPSRGERASNPRSSAETACIGLIDSVALASIPNI